MQKHRALIIDDEPDIRELLGLTLNRMGIDVDTAADISSAKALLEGSNYNICLTDMKLPDGNGIDFVKHAQKAAPNMPIAVITAHGNMDTAIQSLKAGAFDFLTKPIDLSSLRELILSAINTNTIHSNTDLDTGIIGKSESIIQLNKAIKKLSRSQAPVYISGESGSGKELVARSIHSLSSRQDHPFIPVNCGAIPRDLMESEFFGHKKGTFTGATQDKTGLFQAAEGGTLFLDEVADLPIDMQVKLLRAIQEKAIRPIGSNSELKTNVRILSATHKNLGALVEQGEFRQDLFYRLNVIHISVPALRERKADIPTLAEYLLDKIQSEDEDRKLTLASDAITALQRYSFPGNIRELENILERAYTLCETNNIHEQDLQLGSNLGVISSPTTETELLSEPTKTDHFIQSQNYPSLDDYLGEIEKEILCSALDSVRWNKTLAAKKLGITFRSLRYRLQKLGIDTD
ncbi:sigma-54 dependent transcriptional regulator [Teredinibacter sp. KSP-S5-2]|uniref:sigma-54-dependent transcriptional regulator n=1 Tax=Teredinibacter sp. KSP-S5-2 TaxID=3034506 RepID=UPI002934F0B5|nr:sigma-54 dependent transcriptional regulator [Teredinibacter sp. KSP-S5-2]WNO09867.1 sigma-54 dependent transcriptional regulator [Teredinibacter sp. KSP-S5-2]